MQVPFVLPGLDSVQVVLQAVRLAQVPGRLGHFVEPLLHVAFAGHVMIVPLVFLQIVPDGIVPV